jgi:hypothetical protein
MTRAEAFELAKAGVAVRRPHWPASWHFNWMRLAGHDGAFPCLVHAFGAIDVCPYIDSSAGASETWERLQ